MDDNTATDTMMIPCPDCGHMVPSGNMMMHQLTACPGSTRPGISSSATTARDRSGSSNSSSTSNSTPTDDIELLDEHDGDDDHEDDEDEVISIDDDDEEEEYRNGVASATTSTSANAFIDLTSSPSPSRSSNRRSRMTNNTAPPQQQSDQEVINLLDSPQRQNQSRHSATFRSQPSLSSSSSSNAGAAASAAAAADMMDLTGDSDDDGADNSMDNDEWACPKCTLLNDVRLPNCEACHYRNPNYVRPPDSSRTEQLIGGDEMYNSNGGVSSPLHYAAAGGLIGGFMGAAGNYIQGRNVTSGLLDGAMSGVIGGAMLHNVAQPTTGTSSSSQQQQSRRRRTSQRNPPTMTVTHTSTSTSSSRNHRHSNVSDARSSSAMGMASYPTTEHYGGDSSTGNSRSRRQQPRNSYRSVQTRNPDGSVTTTTTGGGRTTRSTSFTAMGGSGGGGGASNLQDPMMQLLLHQQLAGFAGVGAGPFGGVTTRSGAGGSSFLLGGHGGQLNFGSFGGGGPDIDRMSYEQLLQQFGDGSENRGADDGSIGRLPVKKLTDPSKELPEDARQCMICLEDFEKGEKRITLPCLHGFHESCCKKWLRQNGSCPICKMKIDGSGTSSSS